MFISIHICTLCSSAFSPWYILCVYYVRMYGICICTYTVCICVCGICTVYVCTYVCMCVWYICILREYVHMYGICICMYTVCICVWYICIRVYGIYVYCVYMFPLCVYILYIRMYTMCQHYCPHVTTLWVLPSLYTVYILYVYNTPPLSLWVV